MNWLKRLLASSSPRRITVDEPLVVESPRIGFLNLLGPAAQGILDEDKIAFSPLFTSLHESSTTPPVCSVLMIYAHVEPDGRIAGSSDGLRDIIRKSNASIVVLASENEGNNYVAAGK